MVQKRKRGRPTAYKEEYNLQAEKLCSIVGAVDVQLAEFFNVSEVTLDAWKKKHPEFLKSIYKGKEKYDSKVVEKALLQRALGYEHEELKLASHEGAFTDEKVVIKKYPPDVQAIKMWLHNRDPNRWKDRKAVEITGHEGGPIQTQNVPLDFSTLTDDELIIVEKLGIKNDENKGD